MTDTDILRRVGEALHGDRWQTALSRDLGVNDRTLRRWLSGESEMPEGILDRLVWLLEVHMLEITKVWRELKGR